MEIQKGSKRAEKDPGAKHPVGPNGRTEKPLKLWPSQTASESIRNRPVNKYPDVNMKNEVENQFSFFKKMLNVFQST